jgi:hypothetical protein
MLNIIKILAVARNGKEEGEIRTETDGATVSVHSKDGGGFLVSFEQYLGGDPGLASGIRTIQCIVHPLKALSLEVYSALNPNIYVSLREDKKTHNLVLVNSGYYLATDGVWKKIPPDCGDFYPDDSLKISMLFKPKEE